MELPPYRETCPACGGPLGAYGTGKTFCVGSRGLARLLGGCRLGRPHLHLRCTTLYSYSGTATKQGCGWRGLCAPQEPIFSKPG